MPTYTPYKPPVNMNPFSAALRQPPLPQALLPTLAPPSASQVSGVQFPNAMPTLGGPQPTSGGGIGGAGQGRGTGMSGPMGGALASAFGATRQGLGLGGFMSGLLGATTAAGIFGGLGKVAGVMGIASGLASLFGVNPEFDVKLGMPTEPDFQSVRDMYGAYAEAAARKEAEQAMADRMNQRQNMFDTEQNRGGWGQRDPSQSPNFGGFGYGDPGWGDTPGMGGGPKGGTDPGGLGGNASTGSRGDE
jgi:hypothetical protein